MFFEITKKIYIIILMLSIFISLFFKYTLINYISIIIHLYKTLGFSIKEMQNTVNNNFGRRIKTSKKL